jgi:hypothetical protein
MGARERTKQVLKRIFKLFAHRCLHSNTSSNSRNDWRKRIPACAKKLLARNLCEERSRDRETSRTCSGNDDGGTTMVRNSRDSWLPRVRATPIGCDLRMNAACPWEFIKHEKFD